MRRGTLGDSGTDEPTQGFNQPSTSRAGAKIVLTARKSTSHHISNSRPVGAAKRKMTYRQRELKQLKEIVKLQSSTKLMIPRAPFARVVREVSLSFNSEITRYTETALEALQEATEMYLTQVLSDAYLLTLHRKCVTLNQADILLLRSLKLNL